MSPKALPITTATSKPSWACSCGCPRNIRVFCHWCDEHRTRVETPVPLQCKAICTRSECSSRQKFGDRHFLYQCRKEQRKENKERREREHAEYLVRQARRERKAQEQAERELRKERKERAERIAAISQQNAIPRSEGTVAAPDSASVAASCHVPDVIVDLGKPLRIVVGSFVGPAFNCDGEPMCEPALPHIEVVQFIREHIVAELPQSAAALIDDVFCYTTYSRTGFIQLVQGSTAADLSQMIRLIQNMSITVFGNIERAGSMLRASPCFKPLWCRQDNKERAGHWRAQDFLSAPAIGEKGMASDVVQVDLADDDMVSHALPAPPLPPPLLPPDQSAPVVSDCIKASPSSERMKAAPSDDDSDVASTAASETAGDDWAVPQPGDTLSAHIGECRGAFFDAMAERRGGHGKWRPQVKSNRRKLVNFSHELEILEFNKEQPPSECQSPVAMPVAMPVAKSMTTDNSDGVSVSGSGAADYKPISRFSDVQLADDLSENLQRCGYSCPTPIQKYSIPIVVQGRDVMASAPTGSGKTCAFLVPCLESLLRRGPPAQSSMRTPSPRGLVLAPTHVLAKQIHAESVKFCSSTGIRTCVIHGGDTPCSVQRRQMQGGCDILVATPGRLIDMCKRGWLSLSLVCFFVLDEADTMLDMGFEPQVREIVEKTDMTRKSHRQSMMFSATISDQVQCMAGDFLNDFLFVSVGQVGGFTQLVTQKYVYVEEHEHAHKVRSMRRALRALPGGSLAIVFVATKRGVDALELELHKEGFPVAALHGDRTKTDQDNALAAFKSGQNPILVATDVAARGLDIPNVDLVINFELPQDLAGLVQRVGRAGRAGRRGEALSMINQRCTYLSQLRKRLQEARQVVPDWFHKLCQKCGKDVDEKNHHSPDPACALPSNHWGTTGQEDAWE